MDANNDIDTKANKINYIGYNFDSSYFCLGTDIGFQVYETNPLNLIISKILNGGIGIIKILDKSNIFCLVGGGKNPRFSPNVLILWDDKNDEISNEYRCDSFIINCYIKQNCIFIICSDNIIIINTKSMELIEKIDTINNPKGIFSICNEPKKYIFSYPDNSKGNILIKFFDNINNINNDKKLNNEKFGGNNTKTIKNAHKGNINTLCFNFAGTKIASASNSGTVIRIFEVESGKLITEFRRGNTDAHIYSLCFSFDDTYIGLTSNHSSCHIFDLQNLKHKSKDPNKNSMMSYISGVGKLISNNQNSHSWRKFDIPKRERSIIAFTKGDNNKCFIIDKGGNYLSANFIEEEPKIIKQKLI